MLQQVGAVLCAALVAGCSIAREKPTQSPADVRGFVLDNRALLWKAQSIANASFAIPLTDTSYLWRTCVRMTTQNAFGGTADKEFLVGVPLGRRLPEILIDDTDAICAGLPHQPFPELEDGYLQKQPAGASKPGKK